MNPLQVADHHLRLINENVTYNFLIIKKTDKHLGGSDHDHGGMIALFWVCWSQEDTLMEKCSKLPAYPHNFILRTICFIIIQVALIAQTNLSADAYFCPMIKPSSNPVLIQNSELSDPTIASHMIVLPGNQAFSNRSSTSIVDRSMNPDCHIYVNYLPIVEIVTQQSRLYIPTEFSIENLLYANLKLERLVNEYAGLKKKSESILKGLDIPYFYGSQDFSNLIKKKKDGLNQSMSRVANQTVSLSGRPRSDTNRWNNQKFSSASTKSSQTENKQCLTFEKRTISYSSGDVSSLGAPSQEQTSKNLEPTSGPVEAIKEIQYGAQQEERLPLMARALRLLGKYLRENKVETIVIVLFLLIVHSLISSSRK